MAVSYNELRPQKLFPSDFNDVTSMEITLEGETYHIDSRINEDDEKEFVLGEEVVGTSMLSTRINSVKSKEYTDIAPEGKEEISFTFTTDNENHPQIVMQLYRHDGENCLAAINGKTVSFVSRSDTVDLIEAVNGIVLDKN